MRNRLTDVNCRQAEVGDKSYRLSDGEGLFLRVMPSGSKLWQFQYVFDGKEKTYSIGPYGSKGSGVSLAEARKKRDEAQEQLRNGRDPTVEKRIQKANKKSEYGTTFKDVAIAWHQRNKPRWSATHTRNVLQSFEDHVFPYIGSLPLAASSLLSSAEN